MEVLIQQKRINNFIFSENEILKDESKMLQGKMQSLSTQGESYELQQQKIKRYIILVSSHMAEKDVNTHLKLQLRCTTRVENICILNYCIVHRFGANAYCAFPSFKA